MSAPIPGSAGSSPGAGFYPDPSIPGYIRYWSGTAWVPGTSRPAPADGEPLPAPPPGVQAPPPVPQPVRQGPGGPAGPRRGGAPSADETGPVFLDEEPAAGAIGGGRDARDAWGAGGADAGRADGRAGGSGYGYDQGYGGGRAVPEQSVPGSRDPRLPDAAGPRGREGTVDLGGRSSSAAQPGGEQRRPGEEAWHREPDPTPRPVTARPLPQQVQAQEQAQGRGQAQGQVPFPSPAGGQGQVGAPGASPYGGWTPSEQPQRTDRHPNPSPDRNLSPGQSPQQQLQNQHQHQPQPHRQPTHQPVPPRQPHPQPQSHPQSHPQPQAQSLPVQQTAAAAPQQMPGQQQATPAGPPPAPAPQQPAPQPASAAQPLPAQQAAP
ncbi:DUF2510 domain-containing protein, partial [Streptomyces huiliensis]|uniref:DUF2510 domain-containing protein n=1 Tax=Streptomyces huiliensis TaxID=2876027 RepID=UPI0021E021FE